MDKSLMNAAGGGKVTVEGLSAEKILSGNKVTVKQGSKKIEEVIGALEANTLTMTQAWYGGDSARPYSFLAANLLRAAPGISVDFVYPLRGSISSGQVGTSSHIDYLTPTARIRGYSGKLKICGGEQNGTAYVRINGANHLLNANTCIEVEYISGQTIEAITRYSTLIILF